MKVKYALTLVLEDYSVSETPSASNRRARSINTCKNRQFIHNNTCRWAYKLECQKNKMVFKIYSGYSGPRGLTFENATFGLSRNTNCGEYLFKNLDNGPSGSFHKFSLKLATVDNCEMSSEDNDDDGVWTYSNIFTWAGPKVDYIDTKSIKLECDYAIKYKIQSEDEVEKMEGDKLIMKIGLDDTFGYKSSYWTNDNLLNENSAPNVEENAKYATFLNTRFNNITVCLESETENCYSHKFSNNKIWGSAKELFSAGYSA